MRPLNAPREPAIDRHRPLPSLRSDLPWLIVLFAAVLWAIVRAVGTSAHVWEDTNIENRFVDDCLDHSHCTIVGPGATIGIFHSAGYLHWRALLTWLGLGLDGTFAVLLVMAATGVVLTALAARRLDGRLAGALAAAIMVRYLGVNLQLDMITDVAPLPFLGAVFLLTATTALDRPRLLRTAAMGLVGAVTANAYATGLLFGVSAVLVAMLIPHRRWSHVAVAALSFGVATFVIAPATWLVDAAIVFSSRVGNRNDVTGTRFSELPIAQLAVVATAVWVFAAATRRNHLRSQLDVPMAVIAPLLLPLVLGTAAGILNPQDKYCAQILAAVAAALGITVLAVIRSFGRLRVPNTVDGLAPYVVALLVGFGWLTHDWLVLRMLTFRDLAAAEHTLAHERGWSWPKVARNLRLLDDVVRHSALRWAPAWPTTGTEGELERAYLFQNPEGAPEKPLLTVACGWIDWSAFRVCSKRDGEAERCTDTGLPATTDSQNDTWPAVPGMPAFEGRSPVRQLLTLSLPLKPHDSCPEDWIHMPRDPKVCPGRIVSVDGSATDVSENGTWARLKRDGSNHREIIIQWALGGPECFNQYSGFPPLFLEGDPRSVEHLKTVLETTAVHP